MMALPLTSDVSDHRINGECTEENDLCGATLWYINQVLMEDDLDDKACMIQDSTLHAAERSLYDVLKKYPSSPNQSSSVSDDCVPHNSTNTVESAGDTSLSNSPSSCPTRSLGDGPVESLVNGPLENQSRYPFNVRVEESKIILPSADGRILEEEPKAETDQRSLPGREESDLGGGRTKMQFAIVDESILHAIFNKGLSLHDGNSESSLKISDGLLPEDVSGESGKQNGKEKESCVRKGASKRVVVQMRSLLMQCMQYVAANDKKSASKLLKQIRASSSPWGDAHQRLAHYFANGLEARLLGAGTPEYKTLAAWSMSRTTEMLKAYKMFLSDFPNLFAPFFFASDTILQVIDKATRVHIIDFGISYGLQWPLLIQRLSTRNGGPPNLRITGIDLPQAGFRPDARARQTGLHLANYCERISFPFQYKGIAQKWETLSVEDLGIENDEVLVVNCFYLSAYLLDNTTVEHNSPRDAVLNLIKKVNPDIFVHGITNAPINSPYFTSRFRETLFYYSSLFDMFEASLPSESEERMVFEREIWGNKIMNIIACEGLERVERQETYKEWHFRTLRAGFKPLPLNQEIMKKVRAMVKSNYHKDFFVDEAKQWMIEGWKKRVLSAYSCWKAA
ncbi:scarecrow-like protein 9 [Diospyros lotus]|uniref:scarecrow-like protein 9 n=1 Tax=Diospyros lotus TaxID=55363 RepID=UPI002251ED32|nr:scarecrow-like protein 9 [Diospyros lotus]